MSPTVLPVSLHHCGTCWLAQPPHLGHLVNELSRKEPSSRLDFQSYHLVLGLAPRWRLVSTRHDIRQISQRLFGLSLYRPLFHPRVPHILPLST